MTKKTSRILSFTIFLSSFFISSGELAAAKKRAPTKAPIIEKKKDEVCPEKAPHPMRISVRHIDPKGIGYKKGYTTLDAFISLPNLINQTWLPFLDLRGHQFNDNRWAANGGIGLRYVGFSRVWGGNTYYDFRNTKRKNYNQIGAGFESLGQVWDFRLNGYYLLGGTTSRHFRTRFDEFEGHSIILARKQEFAMRGMDAEVGSHVNIGRVPLYFAEGFYYLEGQGKTAWGGQARASVDVWDYLRLEGNASYDHIFKWIGQGQISLIAPFGPRKALKERGGSCAQTALLAKRAFQNVGRHEIIPLSTKRSKTPAIDPSTGQPYVVWFVDNTSSSLGTFESPFPLLVDAQNVSQNGEIIYVFPGDGTANGQNSGIVLKDNQQIWGASVTHPLTTKQGAITVPAYASIPPLLGNLGGDVIGVANNNVISGLTVNFLNGDGIVSQTEMTNGLNVSQCTLFGTPAQNAITLGNMVGALILQNNQIGESSSGLFINSFGAQGGVYSILNNVFTSSGVGQINITMISCSNFQTQISNNTMFGSVPSFVLNMADSTADFTVDSNLMLAANDVTSLSLTGASNSSMTFTSNQIFTANLAAVNLTTNNTSSCNLLVKDNLLAAGNQAITITANQTSNLNAVIENNRMSGDQDVALLSNFNDNATGNISVMNNLMENYGSFDTAQLHYNSGGNVSFAFMNNKTSSPVTGSGMSFILTGAGTLSADVADNQFVLGSQGLSITQSLGNSVFNVNGNRFNGNLNGSATVDLSMGTLCLQFLDNISNPALYADGTMPYQFTQTGGTFNLGPMSSNIGQAHLQGVIHQNTPSCP